MLTMQAGESGQELVWTVLTKLREAFGEPGPMSKDMMEPCGSYCLFFFLRGIGALQYFANDKDKESVYWKLFAYLTLSAMAEGLVPTVK